MMAAIAERHISQTGPKDKRSVTLTRSESHNGTILLFQLIYKGKTARSLPNADFPDGFSFRTMKKIGAMKLRPFASLMTL